MDINETIAEVLRLDVEATPGPWYPQATDDRRCMNASYVSTDPKSGLRDMDPQSAERDCRPGSVVAITLLQSPRLANVRDQRWDENTDLIAYYRTAAPALAREVQRLQAECIDLHSALDLSCEREARAHLRGQEAMRERCAARVDRAADEACECDGTLCGPDDVAPHDEDCRRFDLDDLADAIRALEVE